MGKLFKDEKGFGIIGVVLVILTVALIGFAGYYVWQKHDNNKSTVNTSVSSNPTTKQSTVTTNSTDPYAGWKTYCDIYHYCFKYPADWKVSNVVKATQPCDAGGMSLTSPDGAVVLTYINDNNKDGAGGQIGSYTIESSTALSVKGQKLTIIGGYATSDGKRYPSYNLIDTPSDASMLLVGKTVDLPSVITDQGTGNMHCIANLNVLPSAPLDTSDANNWLETTNVQTSLKILKSFSYDLK